MFDGLLRGACTQGPAETLARGLQAALDFVEIEKLQFVELIQGSFNGLNLQHTVGNDFTL